MLEVIPSHLLRLLQAAMVEGHIAKKNSTVPLPTRIADMLARPSAKTANEQCASPTAALASSHAVGISQRRVPREMQRGTRKFIGLHPISTCRNAVARDGKQSAR